MRYSRLEDIGLSKDQIKNNLMFASDQVGDTMTISMSPDDAKEWFGAAPPDLSVEARARTPDWLYTYLRSFYLDDSRPTGWNNTVFEKVGMPHVSMESARRAGAQEEVRQVRMMNMARRSSNWSNRAS